MFKYRPKPYYDLIKMPKEGYASVTISDELKEELISIARENRLHSYASVIKWLIEKAQLTKEVKK